MRNENDRLSTGVPNLSYLTTPWESGRDLEEFYQIAPQPRELVLNMETARIIDFSPSWNTVTEAELINVENTAEPLLTMNDAIQQAVDANLDYLASSRVVAAGEELVLEARAPLLPRFDSVLTGLTIDPTRSESRHSLTGSLVFSQLLFADTASTAYRVQQLFQEVTVLDRETLRLDTIQAASVVYLTVLIASKLEEIQLQNVKLSRTNLNLAQARQTEGVATRAEVYRWQSQIASDRSEVVDAIVQRNLAEMELNRLRNRPLEEDFRTVPDIADSEFRRPMADLAPYIGDPISFEIFREFMVRDGLRDAPELRALDAGIQAQQRILTNTQRRFRLPDLVFQGDLAYVFARSDPGPQALFEAPRTTWSFAINAVYPIYRGGSRYAERRRAREQIDLLGLQRRASANRIEQRIRSSLHVMVGSYAQLDLAEQAAEAAIRTLDLVQESYSQGVVSIIDLIDAQNASLTAELARATALYQFMINLTNVGRAISSFDFINPTNPAVRQAWLDRVEEFFSVARQQRSGRWGGADDKVQMRRAGATSSRPTRRNEELPR